MTVLTRSSGTPLLGGGVPLLNAPPSVVSPPPGGGSDPGTGGGTPPTDLQVVQGFVGDLTMGVNVERGAVWNGFVSASSIANWKSAGITHVRMFVPANSSPWGFATSGAVGAFFDAAQLLINSGLKVLLDAMDVCDTSNLANSGTLPYLNMFFQGAAARNFDINKIAIGFANELAGYDNATYDPWRNQFHTLFRQYMPQHIFLTASAYWGAPDYLVQLVPFMDKRCLYQWHSYPNDANSASAWAATNSSVKAWATANQVVTICGEFGMGPPDGSGEPNVGIHPAVINAAAQGMGEQRPTMWTVTQGGWWQLNNGANDPTLRAADATAFASAATFIKAQSYYSTGNTSGGGGGIITPPSGLTFDMATARPGVPGVNDQFEEFNRDRDWVNNWTHPTQGFSAVRWQPTWKRADGYYGSWEPAEAEIFRIYRKGTSGVDAMTLVFECGPNPAAIPVGDSIVVWNCKGVDGGVDRTMNSVNLSGWNLPLRQKLTVSASTPSAVWDASGRRRIEVNFGAALPGIDFTPDTYVNSWGGTMQNMRLRHWSFYKDASTKALRHPLEWFTDTSLRKVIANGGRVMLGGLQHLPTWYDWTEDYRNFGATLIEDLWRQECQGLAEYFGNTDPRLLAVELENEPTREWADGANGVGYGTLLKDVWYPMARQIWGPARTLVVKATSYGTLDSLQNDFDFACPAGDNAHLVTHNYDGQAHRYDLGGWPLMNFSTYDDATYYAGVLAKKIADLGYKGGGMTENGMAGWEWWNYNQKVDDAERGRRLGRLLTALSEKGLYQFVWGMTGDAYRCATVANNPMWAGEGPTTAPDGLNIECYYDALRPYASRAGFKG